MSRSQEPDTGGGLVEEGGGTYSTPLTALCLSYSRGAAVGCGSPPHRPARHCRPARPPPSFAGRGPTLPPRCLPAAWTAGDAQP